MKTVIPPNPEEVKRIIAATRVCFPETDISLGCMRPTTNLRIDYDKLAVEAGVNRIVMIRPEARDYLRKKGYSFIEKSGCCTLP